MCDSWVVDFRNFAEDMGERPSKKHQIDRIDNDKNYEPSNCMWVLSKDNNRNRRSNVLDENGVLLILKSLYELNMRVCDISKHLGISQSLICSIKSGKNWADVLETYNNTTKIN